MGSNHTHFDTVVRSIKVELESAPIFEILDWNSEPMRIVRTPSMQKQQKTSSGK